MARQRRHNRPSRRRGRFSGLYKVLSILLVAAAIIVAWVRGQRWGDLLSRRRCGEALTEEEQELLRRSRRSFWIWAGISLVMAALSFYALR